MDDNVKSVTELLEDACNLLTNLVQILDIVKVEWAEDWSSWDQEQRDSITKWLTDYYYKRDVTLSVTVEEKMTMDERIQKFWDAQAEWSQATFGTDTERDHIGPLKHLVKEATEAQVRPSDPVEIADCLFLVFDAARRSGMTLDTLVKVAEQKLIVNKTRKWQKPIDDNPVEHVRSCNRHSNCADADQLWLERHPGEKFVPFNIHCHDECCEECFEN